VPPPAPPPASATVASDGSTKVQSASSDTPVPVAMARRVVLGQRATRVLLAMSSSGQGSFDQRVRYLRPGRRLYLVLEDLYTQTAVDVVYDVYLNLPSGAGAKQAMAHWVGDLNFFDALDHKHDHNAGPNFVSYDITAKAQALLIKRQLGPNALVTIVPAGTPAAGARPEIGQVSIVEQ